MEIRSHSLTNAAPSTSRNTATGAARAAGGGPPQSLRLHVYLARIDFDRRCQEVGLTGATRHWLAATMTLDQPLSLNIPGRRETLAEGFGLLRVLAAVKRDHPKVTRRARQVFAHTWLELRAQGGDRAAAWARLGQNPHFWSRCTDKQRARVARTLSLTRDKALRVGAMLGTIIGHRLFEEATAAGRRNALIDYPNAYLHVTQKLLPFPTSENVAWWATMWKRKHLGGIKPDAANAVHERVLSNLDWYRTHFFEPIPNTDPPRMWGDNYTQAFGNDWYRTSLSINDNRDARNACLSAYKLTGASRGADTVCGHAW